MTIYTASTTAQLLQFVTKAVNGDTIQLKAGSYSAVTIANVAKAGVVTITSADANKPAVLTDLAVKNSSGLTFTNLELFGTRDMPFQVYGSSRIVLDRLDVHGTLNGSSNDDYRGMMIRESNTVTVSNSRFHELTSALTHINSQNVNFAGNSFDTIRDDGIAGGGSSNVMIAKNTFTNFDHVGGVHPDAIQFWTANTTTAATDITVTGNVFDRGTGSAVQGIFLNDESGKLAYRNVTITNNVVTGGAYNGIFVRGAVNATLSGNVVVGTADQASWLGVATVANAKITDNKASAFNFADSAVTSSGNVQTTIMPAAAVASRLSATAAAAEAIASVAAVAKAGTLGAAGLPTGVTMIGFIDKPSVGAPAYTFTEVRMDGTANVDRLTAGAVGASRLYGYGGNDSLAGGKNGVASTMEGGKGDDIYALYQTQDRIVELANEGTDSVWTSVDYTLGANLENIRATAAGLTLRGNAGANTLTADVGGSILYGEAGDDMLQGAIGTDRLYGGDGNDRISSGGGDDIIDGGTGNDVLLGGDGKDTITGGDGNDAFEGSAGSDVMTGGRGADSFTYRDGDINTATRDVITDFKVAEGDRIGLSMIDANAKLAGDQAFSFIGNQAFRGAAGELRFAMDGDGITVYGDTNGDRIADLAIHLTGVSTITASSFFL